jgi:hypothetical protein
MFKDAASSTPSLLPHLSDRLTDEVSRGLSQSGYWVVSFSYDGNDLSQWRSYADDGRGVCLGFSLRSMRMNLFETNMPSNRVFFRFPVKYDETELRRLLQPYIKATIDLFVSEDLTGIPADLVLPFQHAAIQTMMHGLYLHAMMHKHDAYKREQEYRLVIAALRTFMEPTNEHKVRVRSDEIVSYLDREIPNWKAPVLTHLRVGPAANPNLEEQLVVAFRSFQLPVPTIERSKVPFRTFRRDRI